jgi:hypothetical protein
MSRDEMRNTWKEMCRALHRPSNLLGVDNISLSLSLPSSMNEPPAFIMSSWKVVASDECNVALDMVEAQKQSSLF